MHQTDKHNQLQQFRDRYHFTVIGVQQNDDGTFDVDLDFDPEFKSLFMKEQGLKRWSTRRYQKVIASALSEYINMFAEDDDEVGRRDGEEQHDG